MTLTTDSVIEGFAFDDLNALLAWGSSLDKAALFSVTLSSVLYTDGDGGIMLLSWPETCEEEGVCISLVECLYCDITIKDIKKIHKQLKKTWENKWSPKRFKL